MRSEAKGVWLVVPREFCKKMIEGIRGWDLGGYQSNANNDFDK